MSERHTCSLGSDTGVLSLSSPRAGSRIVCGPTVEVVRTQKGAGVLRIRTRDLKGPYGSVL